MPKMKTHRGAAKRFKITGTGKIRRRQASLNHMLGICHKERQLSHHSTRTRPVIFTITRFVFELRSHTTSVAVGATFPRA